MRFSSAALAVALLPAILIPVSAHAADPQALLNASRQAVQKADYRATGHLVRVDADGKRTSYDITIKAHWFPGVLRILAEITSPANARAHLLLEMRPGGQNSIQVAHPGDKALAPIPFEQWTDGPLGPVGSVRRGTHDCDILSSKPGATDKTHYSEVRTWFDHTIDFPVYVEKTLKSGGKVKQFTYFGLRHDGGMWSASQIEEKSDGQAGSTLLIINRGSPKANLTVGDFGLERVTRF